MSWLFSQALVAEFSEDICLDGEQSEPSSGTPTQLVYSSQDRTTEFSRRSLSGMTFKRLTEDHGKELLTSFLAAFHAKTSRQQARAQASTGKEAECGVTWHASLARYDPDSSSWKTAQCSLLEGLDEFSETWPRWGTMQSGVCWAQSTPVRRIDGIEFGLWPTPTAQDAKNNGAASQHERNTKPLNAEVGGKLNPVWVEWLMGWPLGWTDLKPLETGKFQQWRRLHGKS